MFDICVNCGQYRPDKAIEPGGPFAVCLECGHQQPFQQLPLFVVSGASAAGKSTVCRLVTQKLNSVVALDMEAEWLSRRSAWRATHDRRFVEEQQRINQWFKAYRTARPAISLLDTTRAGPEQVAGEVTAWINGRLMSQGLRLAGPPANL